MVIADITKAVSMTYCVGQDDILSNKRDARTAYARQVIMYLARRHSDMTLEAVGNYLQRTPATVSHGFQAIAECRAEPIKDFYIKRIEELLEVKSMATDMEILRKAYERENDSRDRRHPELRNWEYYTVGASRADISRLLDEGLIIVAIKTSNLTKYKLSDKGRDLVWATTMEREFTKIPAKSVIDSMNLVVGFDDVKEAIARAIETRRKINFLLEGPPACAKSIMLEGIRSSVPDAYIAFGSRTSASGISDALFEHQPSVLLMDEADKMHNDVYSVLLGLMESGEILETKSQKTRGIKLETIVIGACNSSAKMPAEFLSRFSLHIYFPFYSREEFIEVCQGFLSKAEGCDPDIAALIGQYVYDYKVGDVRKARAVWQLMTESTEEEVQKVVNLMLKYSPDAQRRKKADLLNNRLPGM